MKIYLDCRLAGRRGENVEAEIPGTNGRTWIMPERLVEVIGEIVRVPGLVANGRFFPDPSLGFKNCMIGAKPDPGLEAKRIFSVPESALAMEP